MDAGRLQDLATQRVRALYYLVGFSRAFPGKATLARYIEDWERSTGKGDTPKPRDAWEAQYRSGAWAYLGQLDETSRYSIIVGYLSVLVPRGAVLDVGCGDGVLHERIVANDALRYVGVDISGAAVDMILAKHPQARVSQADAETDIPTERFDAIVFNETLYYFTDPADTLRRYCEKALSPDGVVIVSLYQASRRARAITRQLRSSFEVVDETTTSQKNKSWTCLALVPLTARDRPAAARDLSARRG